MTTTPICCACTLDDLLAMIARENDPDRRQRIVRIAYIRGQTAGLTESLEMSRAAEARIREIMQ